MKNDLKISILSIACVLCTSMAMPAFGASSVRSLGGAGTYSSASSAASVKSGSASAADKTTGSVRGGSVRVNSTSAKDTSGVRASSSRVSATPRLSIGKYLAGSSAVSGGGSNDKVDGELSDNGNLQQRIRILEEFMGFGSTGDNIPEQFDAIQVDVEKLKDDLAALSDGQVTDVTYASGVLTVVKGGDEIVYNLADDFAGMSAIAALETSLDDLQSRLEGYAKLSDLNGYLKSADLSDLEDAVAGLTAADVSMNSAIAALQGGMITEDALNTKLAELKSADADLQAAIDALENALPSTDGLVNKDYVDGVIEGLKAADGALQDAIDAIVAPDVNKAYVDAAIDSLNAAIDGLGAADAAMEQTVAELRALIANAATKEEIKGFVTSSAVDAKINEAIAGLASQEEIKGFVTSGKLQEEIAKLATKDEIANFVTSNDVSTAIENATKDLLTADDVVDFVKSGDMTTAIANATSGLATKKELADAKSELDEAIKKIDAGDVDLTNYYTKSEIDGKLALKADKSELTPLATTAALESAVTNLTTLINNKQAAGDYLVADDLATLEAAVAALETDKATVADLQALQTAVSNLGETYATDAELSAAVAAVEAMIPTIPTKVSAFDNDAGYITNAALSDYAKSADVNAELGKKADVSALTSAVSALEAADSAMDVAIKALQGGGMITEETLNAKVAELQSADAALQSALDKLEEDMPSIEGLAEKTYVESLVSALELADTALQSALTSKADASALESAVADLNTAIVALQAADTSMSQTVAGLQTSLNDMATKQELADAKAELQAKIDGISTGGQVDLTNYYTKSEADAKFATKDELGNKQDKLTAGNGISISDNTISANVDSLGSVSIPELPTWFGEFFLTYNVNENGESEGYTWTDSADLLGGVEEW